MTRERSTATSCRNAEGTSLARAWSRQRLPIAVSRGLSALGPMKSQDSPEAQLRPPDEELFPHAERAEYTVQDIVDVHDTDQFLQRQHTLTQVRRRHRSW